MLLKSIDEGKTKIAKNIMKLNFVITLILSIIIFLIAY